MRILLCSLASYGFLYPSIGVALKLINRGHSVAFATDSSVGTILGDFGLERIPRGLHDGSSFQTGFWAYPESIAIQARHIEWAIRVFRPDVVLGHHLTLGPLIVRDLYRLPTVLMGSLAYLWPACGGDKENAALERHRQWRYQDILAKYSKARSWFGLSTCAGDMELLNGDMFLLRNVPSLCGAKDLPKTVQFAGACLWEPSADDAELSAWIGIQNAQNRQIVYIQQGRFFGNQHFWSAAISAAAECGFSIAASTGAMDCDVGCIPAGSYIRPHVFQGRVLANAAALICSANATAAIGACAAGVPCLLVPCGGEQPDVAWLCERNGIGHICKPSEATIPRIRSELEDITNNVQRKANARAVAEAFSAFESGTIVPELLESVVSDHSSICNVSR